MRLDAFLIADAVSAPPDGKFYLHGGGITRFTLPVLPFTLPQLGVFIRFEIDEGEFDEPRQFRLTFTDPGGVLLVPPQEFASAPLESASLESGEERYVAIALTLGGLTFGRAGLHRLDFHLDGDLVRSMPLPVVALTAEQLETMSRGRAPAPPPPPNRAARREAARRRSEGG